MTLHMVYAPLDMRALRRWAWERGLVRDGLLDEGYALHILLSGMFGKGVLQPFRLFASERRSAAGLYAYTDTHVEQLRRIAAGVAPPDCTATLDPARVRAKAMPVRFREAQQLGFDVRVRPVRRLQCDLKCSSGTVLSKGSEIDAFDSRAPDDGRPAPEKAASREQVYAKWLAERCRAAVCIERCRLAAFRWSRAMRGNGRGSKGPDATLHGVLTVQDPVDFQRLVSSGIGRHKAYGYGMLLLRPPGKTPTPGWLPPAAKETQAQARRRRGETVT